MIKGYLGQVKQVRRVTAVHQVNRASRGCQVYRGLQDRRECVEGLESACLGQKVFWEICMISNCSIIDISYLKVSKYHPLCIDVKVKYKRKLC